MNSEIMSITSALREMGLDPAILKQVRDGVKKAQAPQLDQPVIDRLREEIAEHHRAILVLGRNGGYSVFSPEGHAALRANARKNRPWEASKKSRRSSAKTHAKAHTVH